MTARPPFSIMLQTKDFAVVLRLTVLSELDIGGGPGKLCFSGTRRSRVSPELAPHIGAQQPQPGKPSCEFERIPEQLALEKELLDQSRRFAVGTGMAYAVDGACKWQRFETFASFLQILAYEDMAAKYLAKVVRICRLNACR